MNNRTKLDLLFSMGGVCFAILMLILGLVLNNQANFAKSYVKNQLVAQKITFTPSDKLHGEDKAPGGDCLVEFSAQPLDTGRKAECYANNYIGFHLKSAAKEAGVEGATYASLGSEVSKAKDAAAASPSDTKLADRVVELSALRDTMFKGETLRGLLLTSFGFSIFGDKASTAATVCFIAFVLLLVLSIAGFVHAFVASRSFSYN